MFFQIVNTVNIWIW